MMLWVEYLQRKKLQNCIPVETQTTNIIIHNTLTSWQIWAYFLNTYSPIILAHDENLHKNCKKWIESFKKSRRNVSISQQKDILFKSMGQLEEVWDRWNKQMLRSRSSLLEITTW